MADERENRDITMIEGLIYYIICGNKIRGQEVCSKEPLLGGRAFMDTGFLAENLRMAK